MIHTVASKITNHKRLSIVRQTDFDQIIITNLDSEILYTNIENFFDHISRPLHTRIHNQNKEIYWRGLDYENRFKKSIFFVQQDNKTGKMYNGISLFNGNQYIHCSKEIRRARDFRNSLLFETGARYRFYIDSNLNLFFPDRCINYPFFCFIQNNIASDNDLCFFVNIIDYILCYNISQFFYLETENCGQVAVFAQKESPQLIGIYPELPLFPDFDL